MIVWWAFLLFVHLPVLLEREVKLARAVLHPVVTPLKAHAAWIAARVQPGENDVYFLSGHSGFYYYLTGTTRPLRLPGNVELLEMRDIDILLEAIRHRRLAKLIVDQNFFEIGMYPARCLPGTHRRHRAKLSA